MNYLTLVGPCCKDGFCLSKRLTHSKRKEAVVSATASAPAAQAAENQERRNVPMTTFGLWLIAIIFAGVKFCLAHRLMK
jgi:hypothetical protein